MQKTSPIAEKNSPQKGSNDEDLIELGGCNIRTTWRFPKDTKECPALRCDYEFSTHSACRNHFKKVHAKHSICCPQCNKPYVANNPRNFQIHFEKAHPNARMPFKFEQASSPTVKKDAEKDDRDIDDSDSSDSNASDKITLFGCGMTTKWRIPDGMTNCPVLNCHQKFKTRSTLISHYKENHANGSILCTACVPPKPIRVNRSGDFIGHFERLHPNQVMPFAFNREVRRRKKITHFKSAVCNSFDHFVFI